MKRLVLPGIVLGVLLTGCSPPQNGQEQPGDDPEQSRATEERGRAQQQPSGEAVLTWDMPTTRADQSCLHDIEGFLIRWGNSPDELVQMKHVPVEELNCTGTGEETPCGEIQRCAFTVGGLPPGTWHFVVYASDSELHLSEPSEVGRKQIQPRQ